jgi:hypothetical protein
MDDVRLPQVPAGLRPGQLGVVVLGRVIMGDIAVTLVDLALRGWLSLEEADGGWRLSPLPGPSPAGPQLLAYEESLLESLAAEGQTARLEMLGGELTRTLDDVRTALVREAVHRGWLRHLHHDQRTEAGNELAERIHSFHREVSQRHAQRGNEALAAELLPYAIHFGLADPGTVPLARFAHAWVDRFKNMAGWSAHDPKPGLSSRAGDGFSDERMATRIAEAAYWVNTP